MSFDRGKNIGDWSEIYVFYRLLIDGKVKTADLQAGNEDEEAFLPVLKILREEETGIIKEYYTANEENGERALKLYINENEILSFQLTQLQYQAGLLKHYLLEAQRTNASTNSMLFPDIADHLMSMQVTEVKSPSRAVNERFGGKCDVAVVIKTPDGRRPEAGFSIKSSIKSPAALLNSSGACDFVYKLNNCNDAIMLEVNGINSRQKIIDRIHRIEEKGISKEFVNVSSEVFLNNMEMISSDIPRIMAYGLWNSYAKSTGGRTGSKKRMTDMLEFIQEDNPCDLRKSMNRLDYYSKRIKDFLFASACGMVPDTSWSGDINIRGGYIFVTKNADIFAYHASEENDYKNFLLENTKFDTPSSDRVAPGIIEKNGDDYFTKLNLLIKFLK